MKCPNIDKLSFSHQSKQALKDIRHVKEMSSYLSALLPTGALATIFLGSNPLSASYNIYSSDFVTLGKAVSNIPAIARTQIEKIAGHQALFTQDNKERQFWKAVYLGCKE